MSKGIEYQLCSAWDSWDEIDTFVLQFNDVVLLPHVSRVVGWDVAECMTIDCSNGVVNFYLADGSTQDYNLKIEMEVANGRS